MGGGIINFGSLTLQSATVAGNGPTSGSITSANLKPLGVLTMKNTIVSGPVGATSTNCDASVASNGFNIDSGTSCGLDPGTTPTDQEGANPLLGPLADNGGPTETMLPAPNSPPIDQGSSDGQADATQDQRSLARPVNSLDRPDEDDGTDVGAVEAQGPATPTFTATNPVSPSATDSSPNLIGTTDFGSGPESATQIVFFSDPDCSELVSANSPLPFDTTGIEVTLTPNATTTLYAQTDSDYATQSRCSSTLPTNGSIAYTHDSLGPAMTIDSVPADTTDHTPTFAFHGTDLSPPLTYLCSVDTGTPSYSPCTSPFTSASLGDGSYTFRVKGTDALDQEGAPATQTFTITTPAPPAITPPATVPKKCKKGQKRKKGKCVKKKRKKRK
jgi:hypothetical protein